MCSPLDSHRDAHCRMTETTVMLVGTSGAGKSTLGNFLLYGAPRGGFSTGAGREAVTTTCETRRDSSQPSAPFTVIDTPGIPDPNGDTKQYFDCIVEEARDAGSLNAVVFVTDYSVNRNDVARVARDASVLLQQFNKIGCSTIMACRVPPHLQGLSEEEVRQAEGCWNDYVAEISDAAGLRISSSYFLGADMVSHALEIRELVTACPAAFIANDSGMQTFDELKRCVENRENEHTRGKQLKQDIERLTRETNALERTVLALQENDRMHALNCEGIQEIAEGLEALRKYPILPQAGAFVSKLAGGVYMLIHANRMRDIALNGATIAENEQAVGTMTMELETKQVDVESLERDVETLRKLNQLGG